MKSLLSAVAVAVAMLVASPGAWGQKTSKDTKTRPDAASSEHPFDPYVERLPPSFVGNAPFSLFKALLASPPPTKGEFETSDAFEQRRIAWTERRVLGELTPKSTMVVILHDDEIGDSGFVEKAYDADSRQWTVKLNTGDGCSRRGFAFVSSTKKRGAFTGSNAFGVKKKVEVYNQVVFCLDGIPDSISSTASMEAAAARIARPFIATALIGSPQPPYIESTDDMVEPTISNPVQVNTTRFHLKMDVEGLMIFDRRTGEILSRPPRIEEGMKQRAATKGEATAKE